MCIAIYLVLALGTMEINWERVAEGATRGQRFIAAFFPPDFVSRWDSIADGIMESLWIENKDIDDLATLRNVATRRGYGNLEFLDQRESPEVLARYEANTKEALERGVFGVPTYVIGDELLWGQDRLDFVERILAA